MFQICELAWQQGLELFSHGNYALHRSMEFHAGICNGNVPKCVDYELKGVGFQPTWEVRRELLGYGQSFLLPSVEHFSCWMLMDTRWHLLVHHLETLCALVVS